MTLDPINIVNQIEVLTGEKIIPGKTLLFLDEIQECPKAIMALRYFKENMSDLHVIAAGSLLEFVFHDENFRMPVGRVQLFHMKPVSFKEFLSATGDETPESIHDKATRAVQEYCVLGGMPAVIDEYIAKKSYMSAQDMQNILLTTYQNDFGKYSGGSMLNYCQLIFNKSAALVAKQFKYTHVSSDIQSRELKPALQRLIQAGILHAVYSTAATGLPLNALLNEKKLKLLYLDIGLLKRAWHLDVDILLESDFLAINQGQLAEQFVGQELLAYQDILTPSEVYFWARDKRGASAELDYVINVGSQIIPIEVKSGKSNSMKSLRIFMAEKNSSVGLKISTDSLRQTENILNIPFYMVSEISRLVLTR